MGHPWNEIYLGGLVDSKFPRRLPQNIFLPESALETVGVRTLELSRLNAAAHFYRLLLSAGTVSLTYPENEGDRPTVPSPFLRELEPLRKARMLNRAVERTSGIQFSLRPEDSRSIPELAKALGLAGMVTGLEELRDLNIQGVSGIKSSIEFKPPEPSGFPALPAKREFRVTELDDYISCPYDYYIKHVLKIGPLEEVTEDISPLDRGNMVHSILRNFYLSWNKPVTAEKRGEAKALLINLAGSAFRNEADTVRNRREKDLFLNVMAERFLDAEEAFWKQGMRPVYLEHKIADYRLVLSNGAEVALSAKIDRIDVDGSGNFMIIDYKTGDYPKPKMGIEQDIFQLPIYAAMARHTLSGGAPVFRDAVGLAYYDLKGESGGGARDVVLYNKEARDDHPTSKPKASPKSAAEFTAILEQSMDKARSAIEGILRGDFIPAPRQESACRYCPNGMMCETSDEPEE
jgi:RecB family exonuclease